MLWLVVDEDASDLGMTTTLTVEHVSETHGGVYVAGTVVEEWKGLDEAWQRGIIADLVRQIDRQHLQHPNRFVPSI